MTANEEEFARQALLDVQLLTPNLSTLRTSRDTGFRLRVGQFARLGAYKPNGSVVWRTCPMVSTPHDEFLDSFSIVVLDGEFTSELSRLREDDQLLIDRQAFGFLTLDHSADSRDPWLLATDTGAAPLVSILQDFEVWGRSESIELVYSVRESEELTYHELIAGLVECEYLAEHAHKLQSIPVVTRGQVSGCLNRRIIALIENDDLERATDLELAPEHSRVMLCGNPQMIGDTRVVLKARGTNLSLTRRPGQMMMENYWQAHAHIVMADSAAARPVA